MELLDNNNRPHLKTGPNTSNNELFICFTSRLSSSSSMKIAKSILSPGRAARDPPVSLPTSLSRRLRTNGSIKSGAAGMASPMFPKKKGPGFENPEPSSPKVTCIGQVRVKTKKKVKQQTRSLSRRRSGGEVSFRKVGERELQSGGSPVGVVHSSSSQIQHQECLNGRNQKWVHLPVTICEALRTFGAEFSCLFPCRSSCFSREKGNKEAVSEMDNNGGSCGEAFTRWFVSLQDCEGGKGREIELVVGGGDEEEENGKTEVRQRISMRSSRRHVFEDMEFNEEMADVKDEEEEEKGRVSICVPPKNALLLMRCRSDPMKMADLTNRFWESPAPPDEEDEEQGESVVQIAEVSEKVAAEVSEKVAAEVSEKVAAEVSKEVLAESNNGETEEMDEVANLSESVAQVEEIAVEEEVEKADEDEELQESEEAESNIDAFEDLLGEETAESSIQWQIEQEDIVQAVEEEDETSPELLYSTSFLFQDCETWEMLQEDDENEEDTEKLAMEDDDDEEEETLETASFDGDVEDPTAAVVAAAEENGSEKFEEKRTSTSSNVLPDCLLMMMCEPKLSMEVSKETWVCSTDFVRWLPERPPKKVNVPEEPVVAKKKVNLHPLPPLPEAAVPQQRQQKVQPGRSSCTLPAAAAVSMAAMIEQKLVNAVGYEPFVLTRCKSEPMRTAAAKLLPEACCWKNRKLEPHRNATFGVGAAGVGF